MDVCFYAQILRSVSSRTYSHKSQVKSTDASNIEKGKIHLKHETRGGVQTLVVGTMVILVTSVKRHIGQGSSKSGIFCGRPSISPFIAISFSLIIDTWPKFWWVSWERFFWKCTDSWDNNILVSLRVEFGYFYLNIVKICLSLVEWSPIITLSDNKVTMLKSFRRNLLKFTIKFEVTWWDGVGRVTCTIINWSHWIYNITFRKAT